MSDEWIKLRGKLFNQAEVIHIADELGLRNSFVVGILAELWTYFDQHCGESTTNRFEQKMVEKICHIDVTHLRDKCHNDTNLSHNDKNYRHNAFLELLKEVGWIEQKNDGNYSLPNYENHNGPTAKQRASNQKRQANHRKNKELQKEQVNEVTEQDIFVTQVRDDNVTRKEKKRKEINTIAQKRNCDLFETWWEKYGRKQRKQSTEKYWSKLSLAEKQQCLDVVDAYTENTEAFYRLNPSNYLKEREWENPIVKKEPVKPKTNGVTYGRVASPF